MTEVEELKARIEVLESQIASKDKAPPQGPTLRRAIVEPMYYPETGKFFCVHKWKMVRTDYRMDTYRCLKCGVESNFDLGPPPNFMNYMLPFILGIGLIGGAMVGFSYTQRDIGVSVFAFFISLLSGTGFGLWVREILKNDLIDDSNIGLQVVKRNW